MIEKTSAKVPNCCFKQNDLFCTCLALWNRSCRWSSRRRWSHNLRRKRNQLSINIYWRSSGDMRRPRRNRCNQNCFDCIGLRSRIYLIRQARRTSCSQQTYDNQYRSNQYLLQLEPPRGERWWYSPQVPTSRVCGHPSVFAYRSLDCGESTVTLFAALSIIKPATHLFNGI